jgi:hypothetical protein
LTKPSNAISRQTGKFIAGQVKAIAITFLIFLVITSFHKINRVADAELIIRFRAYVHGVPLELNKQYKNPFGESFEISRFRFYASQIAPVYADLNIKSTGRAVYHLIDFSDSVSTRLVLPVTAGLCNGIRFLLGVDSLDQIAGAQRGALDPARGMYWTWNSGYQSFKIEGYSSASSQPSHIMAYHIGGYRHPFSTVWKIRINTTDDIAFRLTKENKITVEVPIELDYFFDGQTPLHIREISSCMTTGELAWKISENFVGSFNGLTLSKNP